MRKTNKEIEYGVKIKNPKEIIEFLNSKFVKGKIIEITRIILKNNGKYFVKISSEASNSEKHCVFSLKEDLLAQGIAEGMKIAEEVDIPVSEDQLRKLTEAMKMLGFKVASEFKKTRHEYQINNLMVTVDEYKDGAYLEVEGSSSRKIKDFVKKLPIKKLLIFRLKKNLPEKSLIKKT